MTLWGGPRGLLATPPGCGAAAITTQLTGWSDTPTQRAIARASTPLTLTQGCGPPGFAPAFAAGTVNNQAGAYSPFTLTVSRSDPEQDLKALEATLPPGLLANLAGVPQCEEAQVAAGSCPAASQIGTVQVAAGVGPDPVWVTGAIYLTGPYGGAPFGAAIELPAILGPFDLDEDGRPVVIRAAIAIDPTSAQASLVSGPLPQRLKGIPLHLRTVVLRLDRPGFMFNPTNCDPSRVSATITSTQSTSAAVSSPFEAVNCANLMFAPKVQVYTTGHASRANGASLRVRIAYPSGAFGSESWFKQARFVMPRQLSARLTTLQKACPQA